MSTIPYPTSADLEAGLEHILASPKTSGVIELIVSRPGPNERELRQEGILDIEAGLVGDGWAQRGSSRTPNRAPHPEMQLTIMNSRAIDLIARTRDRWALAGDQLYAEIDLSTANLPTGARLAIGGAVVEITREPHTGCAKFKTRYGADALAFVNSPTGRELRLRGVNARVVVGGTIKVGDLLRKLE